MTKRFVISTLLCLFFLNTSVARAEEPAMGTIMSCSTESAAKEQLERMFGIGKKQESWVAVIHEINARQTARVCDVTLTEFTATRVLKSYAWGGNRVLELVEIKTTFMMEAVEALPGIRVSSNVPHTRYTIRVRKGTTS